ncbi:MAG: hypothetical protein JW936_01570 [Sedimentisphaerales bacterium]|nr:hypothetical protein [Sedimentisphaerales bacterium]
MRIATQFSVFLINKPGVLAQTLDSLAAEKVNILAMTMVDSVEHGVLRLVTNNSDKTRKILHQINASLSEHDVICINLPNMSGALADITTKLADAHININYAYCTAGARGGRTTGILKVADIKKALKVLEGSLKTKKAANSQKKAQKTRRPSPGRRA